MTRPNIPDLVAKLQQQEAAVGAAHKALNENTARAQAAFHDTEQQLGLVIRGFTSAPRELEAEQALLLGLEERRLCTDRGSRCADQTVERPNRNAPCAARDASG